MTKRILIVFLMFILFLIMNFYLSSVNTSISMYIPNDPSYITEQPEINADFNFSKSNGRLHLSGNISSTDGEKEVSDFKVIFKVGKNKIASFNEDKFILTETSQSISNFKFIIPNKYFVRYNKLGLLDYYVEVSYVYNNESFNKEYYMWGSSYMKD